MMGDGPHVGGWRRIGSCLSPENKEGAAGRFPFVANHNKQGLVTPRPCGTLGTAYRLGGTHDEFEEIPVPGSHTVMAPSTSRAFGVPVYWV